MRYEFMDYAELTKKIVRETNERKLNWKTVADFLNEHPYESLSESSSLLTILFFNEFHTCDQNNSFIAKTFNLFFIMLDEEFYSGYDGSRTHSVNFYIASANDEFSYRINLNDKEKLDIKAAIQNCCITREVVGNHQSIKILNRLITDYLNNDQYEKER